MTQGKSSVGLLQRAFEENDLTNLSFLVSTRPGLDPNLLIIAIVNHQNFKVNPAVQDATPLLTAVILKREELCKYLIEDGADLNAGKVSGMNPLAFALNQQQYNIAKLLVRSGADLNQLDSEGKTPMYQAIKVGSPAEIVNELLSTGACKDALIDRVSQDTLLSKAVRCGNSPVVKYLLDKGVDVNKRVGETTALKIAVELNLCEIAELLVKNGALVDGNEKDEDPPLFLALMQEDMKILTLLIQNGADVNRKIYLSQQRKNLLQNLKGYTTLLHLAANRLDYQAAKILLDCGADIDAKDENSGFTPIYILMTYTDTMLSPIQKVNYQNVLNLLLERGANLEGVLSFSVVFMALQERNWMALTEIIKFGFNVNSRVKGVLNMTLFGVILTNCDEKDLTTLCLEYGANCLASVFPMKEILPIEIAMAESNTFLIRQIAKNTFSGADCPSTKYQHDESIFKQCLNSDLQLFEGIKDDNIHKIKQAFSTSNDQSLITNGRIFGFRNALCEPIIHNNNEIVQFLLEQGVQPTTLYEGGFTDLHVATLVQNYKACNILLSFGTCYNYKTLGKITPNKIQSTVENSPNKPFVRVKENVKTKNIVLNISKCLSSEVDRLELCLSGTETSIVICSVKHVVNTIFLKCMTSDSNIKSWTPSQEYLQARVPLAETVNKLQPAQDGKSTSGKKIKSLLRSVSRMFAMVRRGQMEVLTVLEERKGSEEFLSYINCVNRRGNTLMGEALQLGFTDIADGIMSLRLNNTCPKV